MNGPRLGLGAALAAAALGGSVAVAASVWGGDPALAASSSSSIVVVGDEIWLTSPDDGSVSILDRASLEPRESIEVGGRPEQLARVGSFTVVTDRNGRDVVVIDDDRDVRRVAVPCGGTEGVAALDGEPATAVVTCPFDARAVILRPADGEVRGWIGLGGRPAGVTATSEQVTVAGESDATLWTLDPAELAGDGPAPGADGRLDVAVQGEKVWSRPERGVTMLRAVAATASGEVAAAYQMVDNDAERPPGSDGSYGSLTDGDPRIEPLVATPCGSRFARFDGTDRELSGPVALAWDDAAARLWVVGRFTGTVAVLDCGARGASGTDVEVIATYRVGEGARGIALSPDGSTAYVDVGFDYAVAALRLDLDAPRRGVEPADVVRRPTGTLSISSDAQAGRRIFNDGRDRHLTPSGVATCASCHFDGGDDGATWRISTDDIPTKLRRTPPLWQLTEGAKPLHWDGEFGSTAELTSATIRNLLGGDGLLVDTAKVAAYLATLTPPPGAAVADDAAEADVAAGEALFEINCASCHAGASGSDGQPHDLGRTSADPDSPLGPVITPTLFGTRARGPWLHDGSADSLADVLAAGHGAVPALDDDDRRRILSYLMTR